MFFRLWFARVKLCCVSTLVFSRPTNTKVPVSRFQPCHCSLNRGYVGRKTRRILCFSHKSEPREADSRKEVFQPHLPVRLPCYDLAPVTDFALGRALRRRTSSALGSHGLTGGVYKARERIHRAMADARLLANPASRSRVADSDPN